MKGGDDTTDAEFTAAARDAVVACFTRRAVGIGPAFRVMNDRSASLILVLDLAGTFVFALEGGLAAILAHLDIFGVLVLSFATALGGGVIRDLLIGSTPPAALRDWRYAGVAFTAGMAAFFFHHFVQEIPAEVIIAFDAAGLALFAIAGTEKALAHSMHPFIAMLLGTITGVGGGTLRDIFLARVPMVLLSDIYATAALAGSAVMIALHRVGVRPALAAATGGFFCFVLRVVAVWRHWNLPTANLP
jgi:uncharacterized membrane protein YeiH